MTTRAHTDGMPSISDYAEYVFGCIVRDYLEFGPKFVRDLRPLDFPDELHKKLAGEIIKQWSIDQTVAPLRIAKALKGKLPDKADAADLLVTWGSYTQLPSTSNFDAYVAEIRKASQKRQLYGIADAACEAALNGQAPDDIYNSIVADLDDYRREAIAAKPQFPLVSALELVTAQFAINYLIDRVLVEGQPCVLGGPKKSLKTTLAILFAIHIALGIPLFGKFEVSRACKVLIASAESGLATIRETAIRICDSLGVNLADIDNLIFTSNVPKPHDPKSWAEFRAAVEESGAEVLVLDPFYRMIPGDGAESIFKMGAVLGIIDDLCQELGITLILCHHLKTSRLNQFAPAELDDLAYAGCAEYFRQWILLSRRDAYTPGTGHHALWATIGGSAGHNSLWGIDIDEGTLDDVGGRRWAASLYRADEARDNAEQRKADAKAATEQKTLDIDRTKVCRLLAKHPNGVTKTFIRDHCGVSSRRWNTTFAAMYEAGDLITCDVQVSNHKTPTTGYKLNTETT